LNNGDRVCDVCGEALPTGQKFRKSTMPAHAATLLSTSNDPDLTPTWTVNDDGTVTMDICLSCTVSMGQLAPDGPSN